MRNKKGFISTSIIYSFFLVFILLMIAILMSYVNKRYLIDKVSNNFETPGTEVRFGCSEEDTLAECLIKGEYVEYDRTKETTKNNQYLASINVKSNDVVEDIKTKIEGRATPNFSSAATTEEGMFSAEDDFGTSYYYRGAEDDNYVSFAGYLWRVVRLNGDGSVRLILNGNTGKNIVYNESLLSDETGAVDRRRNGYMMHYNTIAYGYYDFLYANTDSSNLKSNIDSWYSKINKYKKYLSEDAVYCGDKEAIDVDDNYKCKLTDLFGKDKKINNIRDWMCTQINKSSFNQYYYSSIERIVSFSYNGYSLNSTPTLKCPVSGSTSASLCSSVGLFLGKFNDRCSACHSIMNISSYGVNGCSKYNVNPTYIDEGLFVDKPITGKEYCKVLGMDISKITWDSTNMCYNNDSRVNNGDLSYPIATISADEVIMAGGAYNKANNNYYLYDGKATWTMTLGLIDKSVIVNGTDALGIVQANSDSKKGAFYFSIESDGSLKLRNSRDLSAYARPVINLKSSVMYTSGTGTIDDPYIIGG